MAQSLYEKDPQAWDAIGLYWPNAAQMSRHFVTERDMERALGYGSSVIGKWVKKRGGLSRETDRRAQVWLENMATPVAPVAAPATKAQSGALLLVACDAATAEKAKRLLAILGCEVTEV